MRECYALINIAFSEMLFSEFRLSVILWIFKISKKHVSSYAINVPTIQLNAELEGLGWMGSKWV